MQNRAEVLTLLTELRGRLDELERLVRFGPDHAVVSPQSFESPLVEDVTPTGYAQFRLKGQHVTQQLERFTPVDGFIQFAAPNPDTRCDVAVFELSDLHRNDATPGFGLSLIASGDKQDWFAFEFLNADLDPKQWEWTEWVLKISCQAPGTLYSQFILHGDGDPYHVEVGAHAVSEYATFFHFKLDRGMIPSDRLQAMNQVRLVLSTGGEMMALNLYSFGIYGRQ